MKICVRCKQTPTAAWSKCWCRNCANIASRRYHPKKIAKLKEQVFAVYGRQCACCGENRIQFLTVDHIHNDGALHRSTFAGSQWYMLKREGFPKDKYQILCWNCNMGRARNGGICPHYGHAPTQLLAEENAYKKSIPRPRHLHQVLHTKRQIIYQTQSKTVSAWARHLNLDINRLFYLLNKGETLEEIIANLPKT